MPCPRNLEHKKAVMPYCEVNGGYSKFPNLPIYLYYVISLKWMVFLLDPILSLPCLVPESASYCSCWVELSCLNCWICQFCLHGILYYMLLYGFVKFDTFNVLILFCLFGKPASTTFMNTLTSSLQEGMVKVKYSFIFVQAGPYLLFVTDTTDMSV